MMSFELTLRMEGAMGIVCHVDENGKVDENSCTILLIDGRELGRPLFPHSPYISIPADILSDEEKNKIPYRSKDKDGVVWRHLALDRDDITFLPSDSFSKPTEASTIENIISLKNIYKEEGGVNVFPDLLLPTPLESHLPLIVGRLHLRGGILSEGDPLQDEGNDVIGKFKDVDKSFKNPAESIVYKWNISTANISLILNKIGTNSPEEFKLNLIGDTDILITNRPLTELTTKIGADEDTAIEDVDFGLLYNISDVKKANPFVFHKKPEQPNPETLAGAPRPMICALAQFNDSPNG